MKLVPENINEDQNFERGQDPKSSMDIGMIPEVLERTVDWDLDYGEFHTAYIYKGYPVKIVYAPGALGRGSDFAGVSVEGISEIDGREPKWYKKIENAKRNIEDKIDSYISMNESIDFKRGRDPREVMEVGMDEYLRSLDWPTTRYSLEKEYLDDPNLEILNYKGFTLLLKPEEDYRGKIAIHNPWNSNDIWTGMSNSRKELGEIGAHTRGPSRKAVLDNLKRSINYRLRKTSESYNFERGKDPKKTMDIGRVRSYPGMDPEEFADWFDEEIGEYLTTRDEAQAILDNMIGNDWETDEEVRGYLLGRNVEKELVDDMIKMRDYFNDKKYINKIRLAKWLQILPENWGQ